MNLFNVISDYIKSGKVDLAEKSTTKVKYPDWALQTADAERFNLPDLSLYGNQAELYQRLSWVNTAVTMTAQTGALAPFSVFQLENENKIEVINHPFELLMQKPNPADSRFEFLRATYSARKLTGNAYWWLNMPMKNEPPTEIWFIPPDRIMPKPDKNMYLEGYAYDPGDGQLIALLPNEIVHFRGYNPKNRFVGMSAIECLAVVAIGDMKMQDWNTRLFGQNNARLPGVLSFGDMISDPEWKRMLSEAEDKAAKRQIMMLRGVGTGAVTYQNIAANPKDMEFLAGRAMNKEEIWSVLAPGLVSMLDKNATEANSKTGERTFREHTVYPLIVEIAEKITSEILPYWGENLRGEFEDIRITDRQLELAEIETFSRTHTIDEIRHEKYNDDPIGDERGKLLIVEISKPAFGETTPVEPPAPDGGKPGELPQPKPEEKPAEKSDDGYKNALTLWRRRALRKQKEADIGKFDHEAISPVVNQAIKTQLEMAGACVTKQEREKAINDIFDEFMDVTITYPGDLFSNEPREKIRISGEIDKLVKMVEIGIDAMKGGEGSGFFEHEGRPGEVGGSLPEGQQNKIKFNINYRGNAKRLLGKENVSEIESGIQKARNVYSGKSTKDIIINVVDEGRYAASYDGIQINIDKNIRYLLETNTVEHTIIHEIGHSVQWDLTVGEVPKITDLLPPGKQYELGFKPSESLLMRLDTIAKTEGSSLSELASKNGNEYFAEAFAFYAEGKTENINPEVLIVLEKLS